MPPAHQVIHQIVATRDRLENVADQRRFFFRRYTPKAEPPGFGRFFWLFLTISHGRHHSASPAIRARTAGMPELPEVETVRRGLALKLEGRRLIRVQQNRPDLRFPLPAGFVRRLEGRRVAAVKRRGQVPALLEMDDRDPLLLAHLGMSGRIGLVSRHEGAIPGAADHVILETRRWLEWCNSTTRAVSA